MVTNIPCIMVGCLGILRWAEAGYVPGYRICDCCGSHYALVSPGGQRDGLKIVRRLKPSASKIARMRTGRAAAAAHAVDFQSRWLSKNTAKANQAWLTTDAPSSNGGVSIPAPDAQSASGCVIEEIQPPHFAALIRQCWTMQARLNVVSPCENPIIQIIQATRDGLHVLVYHVTHTYGQWDGWWTITALQTAIQRGFPRQDEKMTSDQRKSANVWR